MRRDIKAKSSQDASHFKDATGFSPVFFLTTWRIRRRKKSLFPWHLRIQGLSSWGRNGTFFPSKKSDFRLLTHCYAMWHFADADSGANFCCLVQMQISTATSEGANLTTVLILCFLFLYERKGSNWDLMEFQPFVVQQCQRYVFWAKPGNTFKGSHNCYCRFIPYW